MATRIGTAPAARSEPNKCASNGCPDVFLVDGSDQLDIAGTEGMRKGPVYAVVGTLATAAQMARLNLPEGAGIDDHEGVVFVPEEVLLGAAVALLASRDRTAPQPVSRWAL